MKCETLCKAQERPERLCGLPPPPCQMRTVSSHRKTISVRDLDGRQFSKERRVLGESAVKECFYL